MANEYRVSTFAAEVLRNGAPTARVTSFGVEVLRSISVVAGGGTRRRQIVNS